MLETAVKAVSLGYIFGLLHLSIATCLWSLIRWRVAPGLRADTGFLIFIGTSFMTLLGSAYILFGVITERIMMSTNFFHQLMNGWTGESITAIGIGVMGLSLVYATRSFLRARLPKTQSVFVENEDGLRIKLIKLVPTACAVGVIHPEIWINPEYWDGLSSGQKNLVLQHEKEHIRRNDNFRKLFMQFIAALFSLISWIKVWPATYELDSELAIDDHCREIDSEASYQELVANATSFSLGLAVEPVSSSLSHADIKYRLDILNSTRKHGSRAASLLVAGIVCVVSTLPLLFLLLHPNTRCLLACYLGY